MILSVHLFLVIGMSNRVSAQCLLRMLHWHYQLWHAVVQIRSRLTTLGADVIRVSRPPIFLTPVLSLCERFSIKLGLNSRRRYHTDSSAPCDSSRILRFSISSSFSSNMVASMQATISGSTIPWRTRERTT